MTRNAHFRRICSLALALAVCLSMGISGSTAAQVQIEADGTAATLSGSETDSPSVSLQSAGDEVTLDGVLYRLSDTQAQAVGYTQDIPSACTIPACVTVDGTVYSVSEIADSAFYNCANLVTVTLPSCVTSIGRQAFAGCVRLTGISIPAGVTAIGYRAFTDCGALAAFTVSPDNPVYSAQDGVLFKGTVLVQYPLGRADASYAAPDGVTEISGYAFYQAAGLRTVSLPDTVTVVGFGAFSGCTALQSVDLGAGLQELEGDAFADCASLTSVSLPASLHSVATNCFRDADSLTAIEVAEGCRRYFDDGGVLYGYGDPYEGESEALVLYAYPAGSGRTSYTVLDGTEIIRADAFWNAARLTAVRLPETLVTIEAGAFTGCGFTSIVIPDSVTELSDNVFQTCDQLAEVSLGAGVTELNSGLFYSCDSLTTFTVPAQVTSIADDAFDGCDSLEAFEVEAGSQTYSSYDGVLYNADQTELLVCPAMRRDTEVELPAAVETVSYGAFADCKFLQRITVAEGNPRYYDVDGVLFERTGEQTFFDSSSRRETTIDFGVSLHTYPLGRAASSYTVPDGVQTIAERAFSRNTALTEIDLSQTAYVRDSAFWFCTNLVRVTGEDLVLLDRNSLFRNDSLPHITLPQTLTGLGNQCLDFDYGLEYIEFLNETPPETSDSFCYGASGLRYVYVPAGTSVAYKAALTGRLYPGAMIVEGRYVPETTLEEKIKNLTGASSAAEINGAAAGIVRLLSSEIGSLSNEQLLKVEELFQAAHEGTLSVTVSSTGGNVDVRGAAVASGLVEQQDADGTVSGTVSVRAEEQPLDAGELLDLAFTMTVNGAQAQLQSPVLVEITLPEDLRDTQFLLVHRSDDGEETAVDYTQNGSTVSFRANSFSSYVFLAPGVSYQADEDGTLYLAAYHADGRMVWVQTTPVSAGESGNIPLPDQSDVRYRAFVLNEACAPAGRAVVRLP